jgi:hypothetical protein
VAPLRLGGLRGKQSTPSVWLGGTGELSAVGERERQGARTRHGARDVFRSYWARQRYDFNSSSMLFEDTANGKLVKNQSYLRASTTLAPL